MLLRNGFNRLDQMIATSPFAVLGVYLDCREQSRRDNY
jgi:hypothetical protein